MMNEPTTAEAANDSLDDSGVFSLEWDDETGLSDADALQRLAQVRRAGNIRAAAQIGELIFRVIFKGDERLLRFRGRKSSSLRKLAAHPRLQMSVSTLHRCVAIYELALRAPEILDYRHVGVGHLSIILGVDPEVQIPMLQAAESQRWSREQLQAETGRHRISRRAPNAEEPALARHLRNLQSVLRNSSKRLKAGASPEPDAGELERVRATLQSIRVACEEAEQALEDSPTLVG